MPSKHNPLELDNHLHFKERHVVFASVDWPQYSWEQWGNLSYVMGVMHAYVNMLWPVLLTYPNLIYQLLAYKLLFYTNIHVSLHLPPTHTPSSYFYSPGVALLLQSIITLWWPISSGCLLKDATFTQPLSWLTLQTSSENGSSFSLDGVSANIC